MTHYTSIMRLLFLLLPSLLQAQTYNNNIVLQHGRVMDPESGLDAVRNVGINSKKIVAISDAPSAGPNRDRCNWTCSRTRIH
jgi:hypothetical protein